MSDVVKVEQGVRMNEPPGEILASDGHCVVVSDATNRRWLQQEIDSCRATEQDLRRQLGAIEDDLSEVEAERKKLEAESQGGGIPDDRR